MSKHRIWKSSADGEFKSKQYCETHRDTTYSTVVGHDHPDALAAAALDGETNSETYIEHLADDA